METYKKPTAFVHGDTHIFHVSKARLSKKTKRIFENFTRIETFGDPDTHWVRITVDPSKPELFTIEPEIVPEQGQLIGGLTTGLRRTHTPLTQNG